MTEKFARQTGFLQSLDPRIRVAGVFLLVIATVVCRDLRVIAVLFLIAVGIAITSSLDLVFLAKRIWSVVLIFTGLIALPALFITPGSVLWAAPWFPVAITQQGLHSALMLILRVETS